VNGKKIEAVITVGFFIKQSTKDFQFFFIQRWDTIQVSHNTQKFSVVDAAILTGL
jgi:6,7-dimethyl-8-ribityllumazine synthase